ncbi:MAG: universal stress protein [Pseudomonadota bacterium]
MSNEISDGVVTACIDGSEITSAVCDAAAWAAQTMAAPVELLHVLEWARTPSGDDLSGAIGLGSRSRLLEELTALDEARGRIALEHGKLLLEEAKARVNGNAADLEVSVQQRRGALLEALQAREDETRLFVIGRLGLDSEGRDAAIGSQVETVVRGIRRPILATVGQFEPPTKFMLAYDGSESANNAVARVARSPLLKGMPGHVVMVGNESDAHQTQLAVAVKTLTDHGHDVDGHLLHGQIVESLMGFRRDNGVGLTVMGAYGHSRFREFFVGSNTERMISGSAVPLLLLR